MNGLHNASLTPKHTSDMEQVFPNNNHAPNDASNLSTPRGTEGQTKRSETIIQDEPGVYITVLSSPDGSNVLKRVRFSRKLFTKEDAEKWWAANGTKLYERHNISREH
ncbi:hypothetical protein GQ457_10G029340 [Hibiscus cannabinus]